jgi:glucose-6-phosphate 1-epimerase
MTSAIAIEPGAAGLDKVVLRHGSGARAEVHLWGATVTAWHPTEGAANQFWLDPRNPYDASGPIRGGIPLVFPWFGPHGIRRELARHGFARTTGGRVLEDRAKSPGAGLIRAMDGGAGTATGTTILLDFTGPESLPSGGAEPLPHCVVSLDVDLFEDGLRVVFAVRNEGDRPLDAEMLLHPYFAVGSVMTAGVRGLQGLTYVDKNDGGQVKRHEREMLGLVPPPDHVFEATPPGDLILLREPLPLLRIRRLTSGHTVVWNSGPARGGGPETAPAFACVEPGRIQSSAIRGLAPGQCDGLGMLVQLAGGSPEAGPGGR